MAHIIQLNQKDSLANKKENFNTFKQDVIHGFACKKKHMGSKYFYDDHGSDLFNLITTHPDYYLTGCELEILDNAKSRIADVIGDKPINLVELGPGEGIKTELLIHHFLQKKMVFTYIPIDVSYPYLSAIANKLEQHNPAIAIKAIHADYFEGLQWINLDSDTCNFVLFLGSSIGNFCIQAAYDFLCHLRSHLHVNDYALIGFDLRKEIELLLRAYDDSYGITRDFNLNLLSRINHELGGHFNLNTFRHHAVYNAELGSMESYLVSQKTQTIEVEALKQSFTFETAEPLHLEYSYKYELTQIEALARHSGFHVVTNFQDPHGYFVDSLWQAV